MPNHHLYHHRQGFNGFADGVEPKAVTQIEAECTQVQQKLDGLHATLKEHQARNTKLQNKQTELRTQKEMQTQVHGQLQLHVNDLQQQLEVLAVTQERASAELTTAKGHFDAASTGKQLGRCRYIFLCLDVFGL